MGLDLKISTGSSLPLYAQLGDQLRRAIASGAVQSGETLPSVRSLAERLVVNPNTVVKAYSELEREGLIEARPGSGYYVSSRRQVFSVEERQRRLEVATQTFISQIAFLDFSWEEIRDLLKTKLDPTRSPRRK